MVAGPDYDSEVVAFADYDTEVLAVADYDKATVDSSKLAALDGI